MTAFDDLTQEIQKAADSNALDLVWQDVEHAKSSGQISEDEYDWLCGYASGK